jgi:hypothetical protein
MLLQVYRSAPLLLWAMIANVLVVTPWSIYKMYTVPEGTYRPFPPLWQVEVDTPPMESPVWWLAMHATIASALVIHMGLYFLFDRPQSYRVIGMLNWVFAILIFMNPWHFSDLPTSVAFVVNMGCTLTMLICIPSDWVAPFDLIRVLHPYIAGLLENVSWLKRLVVSYMLYDGDMRIYITTLGLPIIYFYAKAFWFLADGVMQKGIVLATCAWLADLHHG